MWSFPARFEADPECGFSVTFRDVPEAITQGDTLEEALAEAVNALVAAMEFYFEDNRPVPTPSKARKGEVLVTLPTSVATRFTLPNK